LGVGAVPAGRSARDLLEGIMMIDCDACAVRGPACADCVVTVLLGMPPVRQGADCEPAIDLDGREQAAIAVLAGSGLVPPLRLVVAPPGGNPGSGKDLPGEGRRAAV
jgi:hypothetical protein